MEISNYYSNEYTLKQYKHGKLTVISFSVLITYLLYYYSRVIYKIMKKLI